MIDGIDVRNVRSQFPSLAVTDDGRPRIHLDNPAGTQTPQRVIDRITGYLARANANRGGPFVTSWDSDSIIDAARSAMAAFVGAASSDEVVFGPNMTSLTFQIARALGPRIGPGDEILVTRMDHDGNVTPWRQLAERTGASLKWWDFDPETYRFDLADLSRLVSGRTKIAAISYASNILGTINDVKGAAAISRRPPAASLMSMPFSSRRTARSMSRRSAATFWHARPTSSTDPTLACFGSAAPCSRNFGRKN